MPGRSAPTMAPAARYGVISDFSNRAGTGAQYYLMALGYQDRAPDETGTQYLWSGTSFSAPTISGAVALMAQAFPNLTGSRSYRCCSRAPTTLARRGRFDLRSRPARSCQGVPAQGHDQLCKDRSRGQHDVQRRAACGRGRCEYRAFVRRGHPRRLQSRLCAQPRANAEPGAAGPAACRARLQGDVRTVDANNGLSASR